MRTYYADCYGEQFQSATPLQPVISGLLGHCAENDSIITPGATEVPWAFSNTSQEQEKGEVESGLIFVISELKLISFH